MRSHRLVIWDQLSFAAIAILSAAANMTGEAGTSVTLGYLVFGLMWLGPCLVEEPVRATGKAVPRPN